MASCTKGGRKGRKMAGRNTVKLPSADDVYRLTRKLDEQSDISLKEADWIYSLFSIKTLRTKLNPHSTGADSELMKALGDWFDAVAKKIEQGYRGNFVFTIILVENLSKSLPKNMRQPGGFIYEVQKKARKNLEKYGQVEELFTQLIIDRKIYSSLPKELQELFIEETKNQQNFYVLKSLRAGMYRYPIKTQKGVYTIAQLMKNFTPIMKTNKYNVGNIFLETVQGAYSTLLNPQNSWYLRNLDKSIIFQCIIAAYMNYKELPCVTMLRQNVDFIFIFDGDFVFFTEKDKAHIIKEVLKISLEDIIRNALSENVVDERTLKNMLYKNYIIRLPAEEFIQTSVKYIDNTVQAKTKWKNTRKAVEGEAEWLDLIR